MIVIHLFSKNQRKGRWCFTWEKYTLTIEEASAYFRIGEKKLRRLVDEHRNASWLIINGNRIQIKRRQFEKIIDELEEI